MLPENSNLLTINGGSSSIKFAMYGKGEDKVRICRNCIVWDKNGRNEFQISKAHSKVKVLVIRTNEELMIA